MSIAIKRVYAASSPQDGKRILVDRLWPRGISKDRAMLDEWLKDIAPSTELRRWFAHKVENWPEFVTRFRTELNTKKSVWEPLVVMARQEQITLLYSAKDEHHNNAVVLKAYLQEKL